jgi:flagellar secretion chaperone FliS
MDASTSYREAAVRGATPVQLVICLYDQAIADLRCAVVALKNGDIQARTRGINHALAVITRLQVTLDMERGGDVARNLARFYGMVRAALVEAQLLQSVAALELQISLLSQVHEAWCEVERGDRAQASANSSAAGSSAAMHVAQASVSDQASFTAEAQPRSFAGWSA